MRVDCMVDLQFGSTGKGLFAGYIAKKNGYDTVVNANMPNAGHTFMDKDGKAIIFKVLPAASISPYVKNVLLGPGSVFDPIRLVHEIQELVEFAPKANWQLYIHPNATALRLDDLVDEKDLAEKIGSTGQGAGAAVIRKIRREGENPLREILKEYALETCITTHAQYQDILRASESTFLEGAQGYSLGLNGPFYPYCTSRDCTPAKFFADCAVPVQWLGTTYGVMRLHPIRVGGNSGPVYEDSIETTWDSIGVIEERTTVTNRIRRVFSPSILQAMDALKECQPDSIFMNFCNYNPDLAVEIIPQVNQLAKELVSPYSGVCYTGWGPKESDIRMVDPRGSDNAE